MVKIMAAIKWLRTDTITTLEKRPTWKRVIVYAGSAALTGFTVGVLR